MIGNVTLIQLMLLGLLPLVLFVWIGLVGVLAIKRHWVWAAALLAAGFAAPLWYLMMVLHPFGPVGRLRVLDRAEAPGGTRLVLTQSRSARRVRPYNIYCWIKPPDRPWGCMTVEMESYWWRAGEIRLAGDRAQVFQGRDLVLDVDLKKQTYQLFEEGEPLEPLWTEPGWEPRDGGEFGNVLDRAYGRKAVPPKKVIDRSNVTTTTESSPDRKQP